VQCSATHYDTLGKIYPLMILPTIQMVRFEIHHDTLQHTAHTATHKSTCDFVDSADGALRNPLQRIATHCNTLQHSATLCNTLQHTYLPVISSTMQMVVRFEIHCNTLQESANLQRTTTYYTSHTPTSGFVDNTDGALQNPPQRTAMHCKSLRHTAALCNAHIYPRIRRQCGWCALKSTVTHCKNLQHSATYCNILQHVRDLVILSTTWIVEIHCNILQCTATHCNALQHTAAHVLAHYFVDNANGALRNLLQHSATDCNTLQHLQMWCTTAPHIPASDFVDNADGAFRNPLL